MRNLGYPFRGVSAILTLGLRGCGKNSPNNVLAPSDRAQDPQPEHVVAMVNGTPLTWAEMDKRAMGFLKDDVERVHLIILEPPRRGQGALPPQIGQRVCVQDRHDGGGLEAGPLLTDADRREGLKALAVTLKTRNWTTNDFFLKGPMNEATMRHAKEFEDGMIIDKQPATCAAPSRSATRKSQLRHYQDAGRDQQPEARRARGRPQATAGGRASRGRRANVSECPSAKKGGDPAEFARQA